MPTLLGLNVWTIGSGTFRRFNLVGIGIAFWRKDVTVGAGIEFSYAEATPTVEHILLLLPVNQDVELSSPSPVPCLPACYHVPHELYL